MTLRDRTFCTLAIVCGRDFILSLMFQPAAYTGYGGAHFGPHDPMNTITIPDIVSACEAQTGGALKKTVLGQPQS